MNDRFVRLLELRAVEDQLGLCAVRPEGYEPIALYQVGDCIYASQDTCTHGQASLSDGWLEGFEIGCPVHDGRFDVRDGRPLCFPATDPLRVFPVEIRDGVIWADLSHARRTDR